MINTIDILHFIDIILFYKPAYGFIDHESIMLADNSVNITSAKSSFASANVVVNALA